LEINTYEKNYITIIYFTNSFICSVEF